MIREIQCFIRTLGTIIVSIFFAGRYSKSVSRESTPQPSVVELDSDNECFDQSPIIQVSERYACRKTVLPFSLDVEIELFWNRVPSEDFSSNGAVLPLSESLNVKGPSCRLHHDSGLDSDTANQGSSPPTALLIHTQDSTLDDSLTLSRVHCEIKSREAPPQEGLGPLPKTTLPYIPDSNDQDSSRSAHLLNYIWLLFVKVIDLPQDKSVNYPPSGRL